MANAEVCKLVMLDNMVNSKELGRWTELPDG